MNQTQHHNPWIVVSLGGSLLVPNSVDTTFMNRMTSTLRKLTDEGRQYVVVVGGGKTARNYQEAAKQGGNVPSHDDLDWIGIQATRINAQLFKSQLPEAYGTVITNPEGDTLPRDAKIVIGAGWKPGWSTDYDAAILAGRLGAKRVINLSNVSYVYSEDPNVNRDAVKYEHLTWSQLLKITGDTWKPGLNVPFDPIAAKKCQELGLEAAVLSAADWNNLENALRGEAFDGTLVTP